VALARKKEKADRILAEQQALKEAEEAAAAAAAEAAIKAADPKAKAPPAK
jgi:hypothetical protein